MKVIDKKEDKAVCESMRELCVVTPDNCIDAGVYVVSKGREYLNGANLRGANLSGANLSWADLSGADLSGADLSWADLCEKNKNYLKKKGIIND